MTEKKYYDLDEATKEILADNGELYQKIKAIEELSELIDAISSSITSEMDNETPLTALCNKHEILSEMADVTISLSHLSHIYGDPAEQIQFKLNRYFERKATKESLEVEGKKAFKFRQNQLAELIKNDITKESLPNGYGGT